MKPTSFSLVTYVLCVVLIAYAGTIHFHRWGKAKAENTFGYDASSYYAYLPSIFIYDDLKTQEHTDSIIHAKELRPIYNSKSDSIRVLNYSSGMALIYAPAFFIAHATADSMGYASDGFSLPYQISVTVLCFLISFIGLWYLRKLLLYYFSDKVSAITVFLIAIGTIYFNYVTSDVILPHNILFTVYVLLLLATKRFYETPSYKTSISIGILYGLLVLIRPSEMIAAIIPLLWGLKTINKIALKEHLAFLRNNIKYILISVTCTLLLGSIQVAYWYYVSGKLIYYSYEFGFFWDGRFIYNFLLHWGHGWLVYNPVMIFAIIGTILYLKKGKHKYAILLFALLNFYVVSAWEIWYYSGLPGRAMIQSYAVLAFPLALFIETVLSKKVAKWIFASLALLFLYFNIWLFHNAHLPPLLFDTEAMSGAYFRSVVLRWNVSDEIIKLKDTDELFTGKPKNMKLLYANDFERDTTNCSPIGGINSSNAIYMDGDRTYSTNYIFKLNTEDSDWLRATFDVIPITDEWTNWSMFQFSVKLIGLDDNEIKTRMIRINRLAKGRYIHDDLFLDVKIPDEPIKEVSIYIWNPGSNTSILVDNLKVYTFQE